MAKRRQHGAEFKAKVEVAAIRRDRTLSETTATFGSHSVRVTPWKKQGLAELPDAFILRSDANDIDHEDGLHNGDQFVGSLPLRHVTRRHARSATRRSTCAD